MRRIFKSFEKKIERKKVFRGGLCENLESWFRKKRLFRPFVFLLLFFFNYCCENFSCKHWFTTTIIVDAAVGFFPTKLKFFA